MAVSGSRRHLQLSEILRGSTSQMNSKADALSLWSDLFKKCHQATHEAQW